MATVKTALSLAQPLALAGCLGLLVGCSRGVDRFVVDRVVGEGILVGDLGKVCTMGAALTHPLAAATKHDPHRALVVSEAVGALCEEQEAWEADLDMDRAKANLSALGAARAHEITDASLRSRRAHGRAAARFEASWRQLNLAYGPQGTGECPKIKEKDELVYLLGLISGTLSLIHDRRSGGVNEIALDRLPVIARSAECLDDTRWWRVPTAVRAGAWATLPGSGPPEVDPWALLDEAASEGEASGVRVGRAIQVLIAANAGDTERTRAAIEAHAASLHAVPVAPSFALLDAYATAISLQESDRLWMAEAGHRTPTFGVFPAEEQAPAQVPDLFSGDDPFATPTPSPPEETP